MPDDDAYPFILAVDPGLANGVCLIERATLQKLYSDECAWEALADYVATTLHGRPGEVEVVAERFLITVQTAKNSQAGWSLEVIGQLKLLCRQYGAPPLAPLQSPGDAEDFLNGDRLRALGWWHKGGKGHANMALRHAGLRLLRTGCRDPRLLGLEKT